MVRHLGQNQVIGPAASPALAYVFHVAESPSVDVYAVLHFERHGDPPPLPLPRKCSKFVEAVPYHNNENQ